MKELNSKKVVQKKKNERLKVFDTSYFKDGVEYAWHIKAYDFDEAEMICKRINHKLFGKRVKAD